MPTLGELAVKSRWDGRRLLQGLRVPNFWKRSSYREPRVPSAMEIATIGLDLAKAIFQVHSVSRVSNVVMKSIVSAISTTKIERVTAAIV
jgi:hypothetical protein